MYMKMEGISFRGLTFMFAVAFLVWSSSLEGCHGRVRSKHYWRQNRVASPALYSKKGKAHSHGGSHKGNHHGSASKTKPRPSHKTPQPLPRPVTKPKPNIPRSPPPQKGGHSFMFNVLDFGAKGDGKTDDTKAFQDTWTASCKVAASTFIVPSKYVFLVGPISFSGPYCQPDIVFQLDGTIIAPTDFKVWGKGLLQWLQFTKLMGLTIQGNGVIDGRGSVWWQEISPYDDPIDDEFKLLIPLNSTVQEKPPAPARSELVGKMPRIKPTALRFYGSFNVTVTGITIQNSPQCHLKFDNCIGVLVHDFNVSSPGDSLNTDGIHLQNSKDVLIYSSTLSCGDDCISIQTGCSNVYIHNVNCGPGHGISIGSLGKDNTKACVSNITVRDVIMHNTMNGVRIKTWQGGLGFVQGVLFSNIQVSEVKIPIVIDQFYCDKAKCSNQTSAVALSGINYERIRGTYTVKPVHFACSDNLPCTDISLTAIELKPLQELYHLYGAYCWQTFGELRTPTVPPIDCLQIGKPSSNQIQYDFDSC
ncbi:polygalacturonase [Cucumis melo var. makuwa]|uniref:Polygalacturonase At1g48100-like n=3 Tax=Cucumis melo TaxID=3656 RepID=A0A1S3BFB4_CUCME|nr:polygalacturonase At1g48100-like [Cucumis melo]ADN33828.1 polygalacturonase [Cucumis melo subsp. melo]TYK15613.1 polygalacturonase [Cucumis melo var. makuwa]